MCGSGNCTFVSSWLWKADNVVSRDDIANSDFLNNDRRDSGSFQCYASSEKVLFSISPIEMQKVPLQFNQVTPAMSEGEDRLVLEAAGPDPFPIFPTFQNNGGTKAALLIDFDSPRAQSAQVFYRSGKEEFFESRSVRVSNPRGHKKLCVEIPLNGDETILRFDPGYAPGICAVRHVEARSVQ